MRRAAGPALALAATALVAGSAAAQQDTSRAAARPSTVISASAATSGDARQAIAARPMQTAAQGGGTPNYDVVLEVPRLSVDSIGLTVADLEAHLALAANVARLVSLTAGADVAIGHVKLDVVGVNAEAYLYVDLDNVSRIANRVITTLDRNPRILTQVLRITDTTVATVGGVANTVLAPNGPVSRTVGVVGQTLNNVTRPGGLLSQTVNTLGQTVQRTVDASGNIVERTLNAAGGVVASRTVGNVLSLPVLRTTTNAAGQTVRQVRDASGAVLELVLSSAGRLLSARVLQAAGSR